MYCCRAGKILRWGTAKQMSTDGIALAEDSSEASTPGTSMEGSQQPSTKVAWFSRRKEMPTGAITPTSTAASDVSADF